MTNKEKKHLQKVSRLLAQVLRHTPEMLGLRLDANGWIDTELLLTALDVIGLPVSKEQLELIVVTSDKSRFTLTADGARIRAAQGHSLGVDLGVPSREPPEILYHGTATQNVVSIMRNGLVPNGRQHVHLSRDKDTARTVGSRHGDPIVLLVDSAGMYANGNAFYQADNGVWLTDHVPPTFIRPPE